MTKRKILKQRQRQAGSAAMIIVTGVVVVAAITMAAAAYYMISHDKKPVAVNSVTEPVSPYDPLVTGDSNKDLMSNVLNIKSGMRQEELHLKGVDMVVNDQQGVITDS